MRKIWQERRYDIDWLRILAMLMVFFFHCARFFGGGGWHLKNPGEESLIATLFIGLLDLWIMPLFFLLSGAGSWYALASKTPGQYLLERINIFYGHLWFLQYLFLISVLVLPLLLFLSSERGRRFIAKLAGWCGLWGGVFLFLIPLVVIRIALTHLFQGQQHSWAHFLSFTIFFVIGYIIPADKRFTEGIKKVGWLCLALGIVGFAVEGTFILVLKYNYANLHHPGGEPFSLMYVLFNTAMSLAGWSWVAFVLSLGAKYLNVKSKKVTYGNEAVLPFYIFHQTIILCVGWFVIRWNMDNLSKYLIIAVVSFALIMVLYEMLVRPFNVVRFIFGVNLGEVIEKPDGSIYGDGVNVAARLESLAEPGGVCVSGRVFEQVEGKLDVGFAYLGLQSVKNIKKPVNAYKVLLNQQDAGKIVDVPKSKTPSRRWLVAAIVVSVLAAGGAGILYHRSIPEFEPATVDRMTYPLPDKPSIAVLPFENYSDDTKLNFFASGLTEGLTAPLSRATGLFVIARTSAATYKGKPVDVKRVAEEQGVQYVLEGSIQKADDKLRITTQLVDALNGRHLWADRFDRQAKDVFAIQDEIVKHVMVELQVELTQGAAERVASRGTDSLEAWLLRTEAYGELIKFTREGMRRARELYEPAHQADPSWSRPISALGTINWYEAKRGWSTSKETSIQSGMALAQRAIQMNPYDYGYFYLR